MLFENLTAKLALNYRITHKRIKIYAESTGVGHLKKSKLDIFVHLRIVTIGSPAKVCVCKKKK
jgi:hypothetical protein